MVSVWVEVDRVCDYIPFVSTVSNLTNLFYKSVRVEPPTLTDHYYTYLSHKSAARCVVLLFPVLGNLVVWIYDFFDRKAALAAIRAGELTLKDVPRWNGDREVVVAALVHNGIEIEHADPKLQDDLNIASTAVRTNWKALQHVSPERQREASVVRAAAQAFRVQHESPRHGDDVSPENIAKDMLDEGILLETWEQKASWLLQAGEGRFAFLTPEDRNDPSLALLAISSDATAWNHVGELQNNEEFKQKAIQVNDAVRQYVEGPQLTKQDKQLAAERGAWALYNKLDPSLQERCLEMIPKIRSNAQAFEHAEEDLRKHELINRMAVLVNPKVFQYVNAEFKQDELLALEAIEGDAEMFQYAVEALRKNEKFMFDAYECNCDVLPYLDCAFQEQINAALSAKGGLEALRQRFKSESMSRSPSPLKPLAAAAS